MLESPWSVSADGLAPQRGASDGHLLASFDGGMVKVRIRKANQMTSCVYIPIWGTGELVDASSSG
jgi:hypothetical protein